MGTIITFPAGRRVYSDGRGRTADEPATIIILPVVRVDRYGDEPRDGLRDGGSAAARKGRRPSARR
ncbi:hypothetical protein CCR97_28440 [Rhodoplanes elegans]|uniref:Uncharacterized protein n=2 Tax=Rhodoplanes TaxID=29407 RepID=A0A327JQ41_9BRAD|nr:hypothetical protein [Rhodoplanes elegans]MBK5962094.1 hypothetical protein [Rhodoplanes elegans]RAI28580.1 hypothetical protein CH338_29230 [Rhodoplanes elegans]